MKKVLIIGLAILAFGVVQSQAGGLHFGLPLPPIPLPVPIPPTVVYAPAPNYGPYYPGCVVAPRVYAAPPVIGFQFGSGYGGHYYNHHGSQNDGHHSYNGYGHYGHGDQHHDDGHHWDHGR